MFGPTRSLYHREQLMVSTKAKAAGVSMTMSIKWLLLTSRSSMAGANITMVFDYSTVSHDGGKPPSGISIQSPKLPR